jgi:hypothetical protein
MSEGGFTYETAIHDGMSGPAHHEVAALGELEHAIGKTEKALGGLASAHEHAGKMSGEAKGFLKEFTGSLVPEIAIGEVAAEGIIKLGESFAELGEKIVDFGSSKRTWWRRSPSSAARPRRARRPTQRSSG